MLTFNATEAGSKRFALIEQSTETHQPIVITGARANVVLLAEGDWEAICETLHLLSVPGMRESIREGLAASLDDCDR